MLGPGIASLVYVLTVVGFILTLFLTIFSVTILLQSYLLKISPRIFLHAKYSPSSLSIQQKTAAVSCDNTTAGYSQKLYISPYDGILH